MAKEPKSGKKKLTAKQEMFCQEYLKDLNATQAAKRAGYSEISCKQQGTENLAHPSIAERLAELMEERTKKVQVDAQYVLERAILAHETYFEEHQSSSMKALEMIGRHVDVQAFKDKQEIDVNNLTPEQRKSRLSGLLEKCGIQI